MSTVLQDNAQIANNTIISVPVTKYSEEVYTTAYLNNPIQFDVQGRFNPTSAVAFLSNIPNSLERDISNYTPVNLNSDVVQYKSVNTYSFKLNQEAYKKVFASKIEFTEFGI